MSEPHQFHRPDLESADHEASEEALRRDLSRIIAEDGVIIDVGANRGQFALQILETFKKVHLFCFEPVPEAFAELVAVSQNYPQITPSPLAISTVSGSANLFVTESDVGSSLLEPLAGQPSKWLTTSRTEVVQTQRLDEFLEEKQITFVNLLKSDAQGFDLQVLLSAGKHLNPSAIRAVLVEVNFASFYAGQGDFSQLLDELTKRGYRLAWLYPHRAHDEWLWWADALFIGK